MSAIDRSDVPVQAPDFLVTTKPGVTAVKRVGGTVPKVAVATYDVSGGDSGAVGAHGLGVYIPDNAIITKAWVDVVTTFTDGDDDSATIALHAQAADDIVAAVAISNAANSWDAGLKGTKIGWPNLGADAAHDTQAEVAALFVGTFVKTTAVREITATVGDAALTAGKFNVFVEYHISD